MEISNMYFEALMNNPLKVVMHHPPTIDFKGHAIKFRDRSCFHKLARLLYKLIRCLYVGLIFYYIPYTVIYLQWLTKADPSHGHH